MINTAYTDEQLIAQMVAGSEQALELLYDRYATAVMQIAYRLLHNRSEAEDVVQETFWRAWRNAEQFQRERGSCKSWLFYISRYCALDTLRRQKIRPASAEDERAEWLLAAQADEKNETAQVVFANLTKQQICCTLERLPKKQRIVLWLSFFGGLTRREIAEQEQLPLGTVHTCARMGLMRLREMLGEEEFAAV